MVHDVDDLVAFVFAIRELPVIGIIEEVGLVRGGEDLGDLLKASLHGQGQAGDVGSDGGELLEWRHWLCRWCCRRFDLDHVIPPVLQSCR
jgi:hypothetical protein